jgi:ferritin-like metal-binding protein YciE
MAKAASSQELRNAFKEHEQQTAGQIERLNRVFEEIGERPRGKKCEGMKALIDEGQTMMKETEAGPTRDAALIASAQKVEHYEMASYGTIRTYAEMLGHRKAADLLGQTLQQEKNTDARLSSIAESVSNPGAADGESFVGSERGSSSSRGRRSGNGRGRR